MKNCWIIIDKPLGLTSTQVLGRVRRLLNTKKVGHLGTLDPLATGVLPIALGEATKSINFINNHIKEYEFSIIFGIESETGDLEGIELNSCDFESVNESDIKQNLPAFNGKIIQIPPKYSAVKINGVPAYKLARSGQDVVIKEREIQIFKLDFIQMLSPHEVKLKVLCSAGTYVRVLAQDICKKMGVKGVCSSIRRTKSGSFCIDKAISLENLEKISYNKDESLNDVVNKQVFISVNEVLADIPGFVFDDLEISLLHNGQFIKNEKIVGIFKVLDENNNLKAIAVSEGGIIKPLRNFNL